ncbi:hypothetical protein KAFR_0A04350 [Kazachstania africana CBS 2517]|uniref:USP domain-containing protein n=1 Tax=Kazachstania africana (strain ATCC 22294 / BCRC 22015 / CBS 2517 / CECT 1963 / NBRC 1671 / NRRL Y-8276) TaxID=1071382 RepID=H2ANC0_KAZAF|nr:hypothetical protein KAFR_0A04350 [Kazachstania africana CBS 2517]CCF55870.1 hypothetical protein KAFR_0A04350 [Kazachstania africana CBS 2517]
MNNWHHQFNNTADLTTHLQKSYFRYDNKEKGITRLSFDDRANLLWVGDTYGCVSSYSTGFRLYTRYKGHIGGTNVADVLTLRDGILSLSDDSLHLASRRGVTMLNLTSMDVASFGGLQSMCTKTPDNQTQIYCGGSNLGTGLTCIDLQKGQVSGVIDYKSKVHFLQSSNKLITIGKQSGGVDLLDPNSNLVIESFSAHSETVSSMDVRDYTLVTCGTSRRFNSSFADPFITVYDLRTMTQLPPISFSKGTTMGAGGADFVKLHPVLPTVMIAASKNGPFDFIDLSNPILRTQYVHPGQEIKDLIISPNGDNITVLEIDNTVSTWSRSQNVGQFTNTPGILEYPDFVDDGAHLKLTDVDDKEFPLSSVGLPYYNEKLLSAWPYTVFGSEGTVPRPIDAHLSISSTQNAKASKNGILNRNLLTKEFPFYLYDKTRFGGRNVVQQYVSLRDQRKKITSTNKENIFTYKISDDCAIPPAYRQLPFTYGRYGSEQFDFDAFNKTPYPGLSADVDNVYTNAVLQLYRFVPEIFNFVVGCLKDENFGKANLLSELGYLYDMMDRSKERVCRSSNFQTSLNLSPEADELGLLDQSTHNVELMQKATLSSEKLQKSIAQKFNEFILRKLLKEEFESTGHHITLEQCFGFELVSEMRFKCKHHKTQRDIVPSLAILLPARNGIKHPNKKQNCQTILPYIESSMKRLKYFDNICNVCHKEGVTEYERTISNLPPLLSLELLLSDSEWKDAKPFKNWLSKEFYATIYNNKAVLRNNPNEIKTDSQIFKYELNGYVARITDVDGKSRLVTFVRIYDEVADRFKWYMFNDYLVVEVDEEEALNVSYWWKKPEIVIYCDAEELRKPFFSVDTYSINYNILYRDHFSNGIRARRASEFKLLTLEEAPTPGSLVAIDAEFVLLNDELNEIDCQGIKTIVRSKKTALARLSMVRGSDGDSFGIPFVDDYIVNTTAIENYLTKYSGILPGDLDPERSTKPLVTRDVAYRKVWLLMQLKCVFVGHGLKNDFRNINICVPKEQVRDTAIYFLQGKRFLSLRYLAFVLLGQSIQEDNHDSIEDAYTALVLYKKYLDLKEGGNLQQVIDSLYEEGRALNYKVPENSNTGTPQPSAME